MQESMFSFDGEVARLMIARQNRRPGQPGGILDKPRRNIAVSGQVILDRPISKLDDETVDHDDKFTRCTTRGRGLCRAFIRLLTSHKGEQCGECHSLVNKTTAGSEWSDSLCPKHFNGFPDKNAQCPQSQQNGRGIKHVAGIVAGGRISISWWGVSTQTMPVSGGALRSRQASISTSTSRTVRRHQAATIP